MLSVQSVTKRFGAQLANDNVSFDVREGCIFGLLGPNGAGKTTLIRMMTNIIVPDSGAILLDGVTVGAVQQNDIGYLPEERGLYKKLKVLDQLAYFGKLKGLSGDDAMRRGLQWLRRMHAEDFVPKKIQELSKGMQQKVQFVSTVMHEPKLLILDEPFSGLDPVNAGLFIDVIKELKADGMTIILSTHQMDQVERLCDDIVLINAGKVVLQGSLSEVRARYRRNRLMVAFDGELPPVSDIEGVSIVDSGPQRMELQFDHRQTHDSILRKLVDRTSIIRFEVAEPSLHDIFVDTVTHNA
ncbi:MAG: ATP-binding cassette domain-containing protein [Candidatus Kapabacteria bacterium]|nr:ATP-binding cassette domain-containing protein [Candidatus Kapabacteria bacterium]